MAIHSHAKIWVHLVWATFNRNKMITKDLGNEIFNHLIYKSKKENIHIEKLYICTEHVHMLIELPSTRSIEEVTRLLKGESSYWINKNIFIPTNFRWQRGYGAFSVSASQLHRVKNYIANQKTHHDRINFKDEYDKLCRKHGILT